MPIFTIEIAGRGVIAFVAPNLFTAEVALEGDAEGILDGLFNIANPDGSPLLKAQDAVTVREANEEEETRWHAGVALAIQEGALQNPHEAVTEGFAVYLVPVTAANDDNLEIELEDT
jgi:hypothetical protein